MSFKAALKFSSFLFKLLYFLDWHHRNYAISHLLHAKVAENRREAKIIAKKCYHQFSKLLVEVVKFDQMYDPDKISIGGDPETIRRISPDNPAQTNAIIVTAHYGNWEMAGTACIDKLKRDMISVMRPFSNPLIGKLILKSRCQRDLEVLDKTDFGTTFKLIRGLHNGKNVALLIDQHVRREEGVDTLFFGQICRTIKVPALLHLKTGIPIAPGVVRRTGDDFSFEMIFAPMIEYKPTGNKTQDIATICQLCTSSLEKLIAQQPEQWLWTHRRWKNINRKILPSKPSSRYQW